MRKFLFCICVSFVLLGCKTKEDKSIAVVDEFLTEINDPLKKLNNKLMTDRFGEEFQHRSYYTSKKWNLVSNIENDSIIVVSSQGQTFNGYGRPVEIVQRFALTNKYGKWQICDSYNLMNCDVLDFKIVNVDWNFFWDRKKIDILKHLQKNLILKVVVPGHHTSSDRVEGRLKLVNNSDFDVTDITILIEHFDKNGRSVNTSHETIYDYIRKGGYREFKWHSYDCANSYKQTFKINFIREN